MARIEAMQTTRPPHDPDIIFTPESDGRSTRVELRIGSQSVSRCWIVSHVIRIGIATVRMDGIGGVGTDESYRRMGYARRVLHAALHRVEAGDAAVSMLYGIPGFYPQFGYTTVGPEHYIRLAARRPAVDSRLWQTRPLSTRDIGAIHALYDRSTAGLVGCALRPPTCFAWKRLAAVATTEPADCLVLLGADGSLAGYAWHGSGFWATDVLERDNPDALVISEALATTPAAADALLEACRGWAIERRAVDDRSNKAVYISSPPDGVVGRAALRCDAEVVAVCSACGGSMGRVLSTSRLLAALAPELGARMHRCALRPAMSLRLDAADAGSATLAIDGDRVQLSDTAAHTRAPEDVLRLRQEDLAKLALGACDPFDLLTTISPRPPDRVAEVIAAIFPTRHPHMFVPDRF